MSKPRKINQKTKIAILQSDLGISIEKLNSEIGLIPRKQGVIFYGNKEQLAVLLNAIEKMEICIWNNWRQENSKILIDLRGADLKYAHLMKANLKNANLDAVNLENANLSYADLTNASLIGAQMFSANLKGTICNKVNLDRAQLNNATMTKCKLKGASLKKAYLRNVNLTSADLKKAVLNSANLRFAILNSTNLTQASLRNADLRGANLEKADLSETDLLLADFEEARLNKVKLISAGMRQTNLSKANLRDANLNGANLSEANLSEANLHDASLNKSHLDRCTMIKTDLSGTDISGSSVYGISVWDVRGKSSNQKDLIITPHGDAQITVDNLEVAQFIYLILKNKKIRDVIDTITSKAVLILGRFTEERLQVLNSIREHLRTKYNFVPIIFDFNPPHNRNLTETVLTLTGISKFVIADLTMAKSIQQELATILPQLPSVPIKPIIKRGERPWIMESDLRIRPNYMDLYEYENVKGLLNELKVKIIDPSINWVNPKNLIKDQKKEIEELKVKINKLKMNSIS